MVEKQGHGGVSLQLAAISLLVKAMALEHPNREAVLTTYDQLCAQLMSSVTYLKGTDESQKHIRTVFDDLRKVLE